MRILSRKTLSTFWKQHPEVESSLKAWFADVKRAKWTGPNDIKKKYSTASFLEGDRIVFNIKGNKFRLIVAVRYKFKVVMIKFIGSHKEYGEINATLIGLPKRKKSG